MSRRRVLASSSSIGWHVHVFAGELPVGEWRLEKGNMDAITQEPQEGKCIGVEENKAVTSRKAQICRWL